jgi:hypothetical protein
MAVSTRGGAGGFEPCTYSSATSMVRQTAGTYPGPHRRWRFGWRPPAPHRRLAGTSVACPLVIGGGPAAIVEVPAALLEVAPRSGDPIMTEVVATSVEG